MEATVMIKKIGMIKHFAVFENYNWDLSSTDKNGQPLKFEKINILYGRNYSGKTTLSRIFRSLETGQLPENYDDPQYELNDENGTKIDQNNLADFSSPVRVFNEDFIKSNLKFLIDPTGEIAPFAILGNTNGTLVDEIKELTKEIGSSEDPKTGLNKAVDDANNALDSANRALSEAESDLKSKLSKKATDKSIGIKYKSDRFGDVNYTIAKIRSDIETIYQNEYQGPSTADIANCEAILRDTVHEPITNIRFQHQYSTYKDEAVSLLEKEIGTSNKIQRLIHDTALNLWVKRGVEIADNASICPFCGNPITDEFWSELHAHFDEESRKLENDIGGLIEQIRKEINKGAINDASIKLQLYSEYIGKYEVAKKSLDEKLSEYYNALQELIDQLEKRLANISHPVEFLSDRNCDNDIEEALNRLNLVLNENNSYAGELKNKQTSAKTVLRLKEVEDFCNTIDYRAISEKIEKLKSIRDAAESKLNDVKDDLSNKQEALDGKKRLLNDEELGAKHVNEYLNDFFGHHFVTLEAHKDNDDAKQIKFCIMRNGKPAYNLSEGECSLISFCYFMAKLDDVATSGQKPIIWIDDPISSLDSNHIYFIFSLIVSKIAKTGCFSQLFISTHNLDFLKYLNRLKSYHLDKNGKQVADSKAYFLIDRIGNHSSIQALPQYLKSNATEYNYLFSQIYKVSQCVAVTDDNYDILYSFGNSARKFLEMYLYFKYPTNEELLPKLKRFFEPEDVPPILINRLVNEDSHGPTPENSLRAGIDPETIPVAQKILQLLQKDSEQYDAFMESIS